MPKCDVLQKILNELDRYNDFYMYGQGIGDSTKYIRELCESAIAEKVELKGQRASDKVPTIFISFNGDDYIVPSPSGNPDEEYFTDSFTDALDTYDAMRQNTVRAQRVVVTLREID